MDDKEIMIYPNDQREFWSLLPTTDDKSRVLWKRADDTFTDLSVLLVLADIEERFSSLIDDEKSVPDYVNLVAAGEWQTGQAPHEVNIQFGFQDNRTKIFHIGTAHKDSIDNLTLSPVYRKTSYPLKFETRLLLGYYRNAGFVLSSNQKTVMHALVAHVYDRELHTL